MYPSRENLAQTLRLAGIAGSLALAGCLALGTDGNGTAMGIPAGEGASSAPASSFPSALPARPPGIALDDPTDPTPLQPAPLSLVLLGTFASDTPSLSRASLLDRASEERFVVGVGDQIEDRAFVVRIERGRVLLREDGMLRELTHAGGRVAALAPALSDREHEILNDEFDGVHVFPVFDEGGMVGLEFGLVQYDTPFAHVGLEPGDVITELNGTPIDSPGMSAELLELVSGAYALRAAGYRADGSSRVWNTERADG